jgi:hypothetical protein
MHPANVALIAIGIFVLFDLLWLILLSRGNFRRMGVAFRCFAKALGDQAFTDKVTPLLARPEPKGVQPERPSGVPVRLLALLQRDGRLIDFLMEDLQGAADSQILAAVREVHPKCQETLKKHVVLAPVLPQQENTSVEVPPGFDPSAIRLTGNVTGEPPFHGTLQHPGWRVQEIHLPPLPEGQDDLILAPAEVELP